MSYTITAAPMSVGGALLTVGGIFLACIIAAFLVALFMSAGTCRHQWSKWEPIVLNRMVFRHGNRIEGTVDAQERRCESCGETQRKDFR